MELSQMTLFKMARQKMSWLGQRQAVLAQNIANANTPDYRSKELEALDFGRELKRLAPVRMAATAGRHLAGTVTPPEYRVDKVKLRDVYEVNPDGNSVVMEEQLMKLSDNQLQYQLATNIYQKHVKMFRLALGNQSQG
ncbi:flagellar basal body rod protein FlgB [Thalassobaculum fulvum]|uniref:Flagellar basal body rod protein FlgB n=1 Tax=Thalassobaculum fulvum TaxID=1633335 RepID=A0A918XWN7_9PROT|nr:flagellar basal body rod protein FlgB [Thalassobaculum fulvum]GHD61018.1 flagellar basal body rod protein FlgB [Thalassobaculum fulvum]